jgi:uncharacterized membrane protein
VFNSDLLIIFRVYIISLGLQFVCWPVVKKIFHNLPDKGWPVARLVTSLVSALIIWQLGNLGLAINTNAGLSLTTGFLILISLSIVLKNGFKAISVPKESLKIIFLEEYLFAVGLLAISIVRGFLPNIDSLEKFMDFGFIQRYLTSSTLPAEDMWQAGKSINYYSFGHFWASILVRFFGVPLAIGYNLVLGYIAGLALSLSFSVAYILAGAKSQKAGILGGLIGAFTVVLAGNTHVIWYLINHKGMNGYWYAEATRFIHNTIHEFPVYSFVVSDLHGHLLDLPMVLLLIIVTLHWLKNRGWLDEVVMGILFGVMMMTNTWDVAVYGLLLTVLSIQLIVSNKKEFLKLIRSAGIMLLFMALTALPWWVSFQSISNGIALVKERSPLWQLAVLWAGGLVISLSVVITEGRGKQSLIIRTLVVTTVLLILIPEIVYAKDIYPDHPRANTMFKLTYQASILIGLLAGALWGKLFDMERKLPVWWRWSVVPVVIIIFLGTMIFPTQSFTTFYESFNNYRGLDGEAWMEKDMPEKYKAIQFLRENVDGKNMIEAVGDSYTQLNAVSVFSGVPTVQGWRVHEWLWRGGYDSVATREAEVRQFYETSDIEKQKELIEKYRIGWILVGNDEREHYQIDEESLSLLGEKIWSDGETYLIKVK